MDSGANFKSGTLREKGIFAGEKRHFCSQKRHFCRLKKGMAAQKKGMAGQKKGMAPQKRAWRSVMLNIPGGITTSNSRKEGVSA